MRRSLVNSRKRTELLKAALATALFGAPVPCALAQSETAGDASAGILEEVIVTASRRAESLQDTGLSVTAWQPEDFVSVGLDSLREVIEYSPGVYYRGGGTPSDNAITMRGVSNFSAAPSVAVYVDDVPIGSGNNNASGGTLALDVMQMDIERVEIIKGPQGTLYGASAMGGLVRYITRDASMEETNGQVDADWGYLAHGDFSQKYRARVSTPIAEEKVGFSISGFYEDVGGFIDRIPEAASGAASDVNGYDSYGMMAKLNSNFTDRFSGTLLAMYTDTEWHGANIVALNGGPPFVPANGPYETDTSYSDDENTFTLYALTLDYQFDSASLVSSTSYQERRSSAITDLVADFGPLLELFAGVPVENAPFTGAIPTDRFVQELRLTSEKSDALEWTVGAIYSDEESGNQQKLEGLPSGFVLLDVNIPSALEELAGFGSLTWYLTPDFDLTAGARVARVETSVAVDDGPNILVADTPPTTSSDTIDTWSFGARYRPSEQMSLYGRIASGYRPETANLPLLDASGNNVAPVVVASDTVWSYEAGAKGSNSDGTVAYDVAAWYLNWEDLQARVFVNGVMTGGNANSDVTAYGFEGSLTFVPVDDLTVVASLAYTDSTLDDDETSAFGAVAGENLPGIPEWAGAVRANYDFTVNGTDGFVGGGIRYVGDMDTGFEGGTGADGSTITPLIYNFVLEDHFVADAHIGLRWDRFTGTLYATNLFDEYAYSGGSARPAAGFIRATANVITPRVIGARLTFNF
jgi:outer membrane receptor protein involved in Fe transport